MKFSAREDIEAPIAQVYARVTDFGAFERQILRRGADVRRIDADRPAAPGSSWDVAFTFRGRDRRVHATVAKIQEPTDVVIDLSASGLDGVTTIALVPLTPQRTRLAVSIELSAKTLTARLLLQSLKLAKSNLSNRCKKRVADFAKDVEDRAPKSA